MRLLLSLEFSVAPGLMVSTVIIPFSSVILISVKSSHKLIVLGHF
jgi:hypothetical protein